jgi:hypothetical protein
MEVIVIARVVYRHRVRNARSGDAVNASQAGLQARKDFKRPY